MKVLVLHIITSLNTGGAEMMLYKLASGMNKEAFKPVVISLMGEAVLLPRFRESGIEVHCLGLDRGRLSLQAIIRFYKLLKVIKPDVIQGWMNHGNLFAVLAKLIIFKRIPCFWNIRQCVYDLSHEKRMTAILIKLGARLSFLSSAVIYNSRLSRNQHEAIGYSKKKSVMIANGFDVSVFKKNYESYRQIRRELGISEDALLIGMIARFDPMKDHHNFLCAAGQVAKVIPNACFLLAGRDVSSENTEVMHWVEAYSLQDRIFLLGERHDIPSLNAAMDVAVLSSNSEAFPNVVGEAMASSTPCVVTDVGDAAFVVGDTGYVVAPSNSEALAEAIIDLLRLPEAERLHLGDMARLRIEECFSLEKIVKQYEALYRN